MRQVSRANNSISAQFQPASLSFFLFPVINCPRVSLFKSSSHWSQRFSVHPSAVSSKSSLSMSVFALIFLCERIVFSFLQRSLLFPLIAGGKVFMLVLVFLHFLYALLVWPLPVNWTTTYGYIIPYKVWLLHSFNSCSSIVVIGNLLMLKPKLLLDPFSHQINILIVFIYNLVSITTSFFFYQTLVSLHWLIALGCHQWRVCSNQQQGSALAIIYLVELRMDFSSFSSFQIKLCWFDWAFIFVLIF